MSRVLIPLSSGDGKEQLPIKRKSWQGFFHLHTEAKAFIPSSFFIDNFWLEWAWGAIFESIETAELRTLFVKNKTIMMLDIISYIYLVFDLWVLYVTKIAFSFKKRTKKHTVRHNRRSSSVHKLPAAWTQPADTVAGNHAASCATQLWVLPKVYEALLTWMGLCLTISITSMYSNGGWGKRRKKKHNQTLNEWNNLLKGSWTVLVRKCHDI